LFDFFFGLNYYQAMQKIETAGNIPFGFSHLLLIGNATGLHKDIRQKERIG
jgi:hypothetical protein